MLCGESQPRHGATLPVVAQVRLMPAVEDDGAGHGNEPPVVSEPEPEIPVADHLECLVEAAGETQGARRYDDSRGNESVAPGELFPRAPWIAAVGDHALREPPPLFVHVLPRCKREHGAWGATEGGHHLLEVASRPHIVGVEKRGVLALRPPESRVPGR